MAITASPSTARPTHIDLTGRLDLASARFGGQVCGTNDDFFAPCENLIAPTEPVWIGDKYTERGKWMDGWESRRRRKPGFDWCVVQLGSLGHIHGVDVDTAYFTGNFPESASVEACRMQGISVGDALKPDVVWTPIVAKAMLRGDTHNMLVCEQRGPWSHVRLKIFPDGGVARLRVFGEVAPEALRHALEGTPRIDMAAAIHGARAVACSDMYFGNKDNLIMPGRAVNMGDGWETRRRRGPGHDWIVVKLAARTRIGKLEISTHHFKGNFPDTCSVETCDLPNDVGAAEFLPAQTPQAWTPLLGAQKLAADTEHAYDTLDARGTTATHVRLNIFPDGGISRLRVFGTLA